MAEEPLRIFISYRRKETQGYVGWLSYCLESEFGRGNVFRDVESIGIGDWKTSIDRAIRLSDVVLCVMGEQWLSIKDDKKGTRRLDDAEDMVRWEMAKALDFMAEHDRVALVLLENTQPPPADELPEELKRLPAMQAYRVRYEDWPAEVQRLIDALKRIKPRRPRKLKGEEVVDRWHGGHDVPGWIGRGGGQHGSLFRGDVESGSWRNFEYEVNFTSEAPNLRTWFSIRDFLRAVGVLDTPDPGNEV